jgi:hypothetical protein
MRQRYDILGNSPDNADVTVSWHGHTVRPRVAGDGFTTMIDLKSADNGELVPVTITCPGCGTITLQLLKSGNSVDPIGAEGTLAETEPQLAPENPAGFIVGGYAPSNAKVVTVTTAYGVRTFRVNGGAGLPTMWGGFIDFPDVAHGASFAATITTDDPHTAPLDVTLTRR